jgi:hypothetical protein
VLFNGDLLDRLVTESIDPRLVGTRLGIERAKAKDDDAPNGPLVCLRSVGQVRVDVLKLPDVGRLTARNLEGVELSTLFAVIADGSVTLGHQLIADLPLARVVEKPVVSPAVVQVAVEDSPGWVGEHENVRRDLGRADPALASSAVTFVELD